MHLSEGDEAWMYAIWILSMFVFAIWIRHVHGVYMFVYAFNLAQSRPIETANKSTEYTYLAGP